MLEYYGDKGEKLSNHVSSIALSRNTGTQRIDDMTIDCTQIVSNLKVELVRPNILRLYNTIQVS